MAKFNKKKSGDLPAISTASLPDIVFMLLFFLSRRRSIDLEHVGASSFAHGLSGFLCWGSFCVILLVFVFDLFGFCKLGGTAVRA